MSLLIDTPLWPWRGRLWAHLISDSDLDELHEGARRLGLRYLSFGRDHYDVPDTLWPDAARIATVVDPREIVRTLRRTGQRVSGGKAEKAWRPVPSLPGDLTTPAVRGWLDAMRPLAVDASIEVLTRPDEWVVLHIWDSPHRPDLGSLADGPHSTARVHQTIADGRYSVELILSSRRGSG